MQIDLKGRTALVTGSTQGIGAAIATGLARSGARVAVNGRSAERVREGAAAVEREVPGAEVVPVAADVTTEEGAGKVVEALPRVDILVNNLGVFGAADPLEPSLAIATSAPYPVSHADVRVIRAVSRSAAAVVRAAVSAAVGAGAAGASVAVVRARRRALARAAAAAAGRDGRRAGVMWGGLRPGRLGKFPNLKEPEPAFHCKVHDNKSPGGANDGPLSAAAAGRGRRTRSRR